MCTRQITMLFNQFVVTMQTPRKLPFFLLFYYFPILICCLATLSKASWLWWKSNKNEDELRHPPMLSSNMLIQRSGGGSGWGWGGWGGHHHVHHVHDQNMDLYSLLGGLSFAALLGATILALARRNNTGRRKRSLGKDGVVRYHLENEMDEDDLEGLNFTQLINHYIYPSEKQYGKEQGDNLSQWMHNN